MHLMCLEISHNCLAKRPRTSVIGVQRSVGNVLKVYCVIPVGNVFKTCTDEINIFH